MLAAKRLVGHWRRQARTFSTVEARRIAGSLVRGLKAKAYIASRWCLSLLIQRRDRVVEGALLGAWEANKYKSDPKKNDKRIDSFALCLSTATPEARNAFERGRMIGEAQNLTRDLVNEPANKLTPADLAEAARAMASSYGLECEVLDTAAMIKLGMGALLGVAQGSSNPPFLVVMKYRPAHPPATITWRWSAKA